MRLVEQTVEAFAAPANPDVQIGAKGMNDALKALEI